MGVRSRWKALQGQQASVTAVCVSTTTTFFPVPTQAFTNAPQDLRARAFMRPGWYPLMSVL